MLFQIVYQWLGQQSNQKGSQKSENYFSDSYSKLIE